MTIDNTTISFVSLVGAILVPVIQVVVHWDKIRPALTSGKAIALFEVALLLGCFHLGPWGVMVGAYLYVLLVAGDFMRSGENGCGAIGCAILTAANGVFTFAIQFAYLIQGE